MVAALNEGLARLVEESCYMPQTLLEPRGPLMLCGTNSLPVSQHGRVSRSVFCRHLILFIRSLRSVIFRSLRRNVFVDYDGDGDGDDHH